LKEVKAREYLVEYKDHGKPFQVYEKLFTKQDIDRTVELMEEEMQKNEDKLLKDAGRVVGNYIVELKKQKAEFRKMIEELQVDIDNGFHPIEKYVNVKELLAKLGDNQK